LGIDVYMELKEALKKYSYAGVVTMLLVGSLILDIPVYECPGNEPPTRECIKLSASERTCYHTTGRDLCSDGRWELLGPHIEGYKSNKERCTPQGCVAIT